MDNMQDNRLEDLIDELVILKGFAGSDTVDRKIQVLCYVLEQLKFRRGADSDEITFEKYVQSHIQINGNKLVVSAPEVFTDVGSGTSPIQLQAPLLLFLLLNHQERYQVLDIIRLFIEQIRGRLSFLDFKKTKTGVTRCFTNTRFAAHVLRDYGLLKFTRREAFKTWELSLTGFLVAADILEKRSRAQSSWELTVNDRNARLDLTPEIYLACEGIRHFDDFVHKLS